MSLDERMVIGKNVVTERRIVVSATNERVLYS